jgi:hypothetical protein
VLLTTPTSTAPDLLLPCLLCPPQVPLSPGLKVSPEWRLVLPLLQRPEAVSRLQASDPVLQVAAGVSGVPSPSSSSPAAVGGSGGGVDGVSTDSEQQDRQEASGTQVLSLDWYPPSGEAGLNDCSDSCLVRRSTDGSARSNKLAYLHAFHTCDLCVCSNQDVGV